MGIPRRPVYPSPWEWGPSKWAEIHRKKDADQTYIDDLINFLASKKTCSCHTDASDFLATSPPRFDDWFAWSVEFHNAVNAKLGKPQMSLDDATKRWFPPKLDIEISKIFGAVKVISLVRTPDRLKDFFASWPRDWPWMQPQHFEAVDGETATVPVGWNWHNSNKAAVGCWHSWIAILDELIANGVDRPALVMEDDCQLVEGAIEKINEAFAELPADWQIFFLGGEHNKQPLHVTDKIARVRETGRTHAVVINPTFFNELRAYWKSNPYHVDWGLRRFAPSKNFYTIKPSVAFQRANFSTLRNQMVSATGWDDRMQLPGARYATVFHHAGDVGDIIYSLPTIRAMCGGSKADLKAKTEAKAEAKAKLILHPVNYTRLRMSESTAEQLRTLLMAQPYIESVEFRETPETPEGFDLNAWRHRGYPGKYNLADRHLDLGGWAHGEREIPWLSVPPILAGPVLFARSARYHNHRVDWKRLLATYPDAVFVGLEEEHTQFVAEVGPIPWHRTADLMALAQVIAGCNMFCANQSTPLAMAIAMSKSITVEPASPPNDNCHFERKNAKYLY